MRVFEHLLSLPGVFLLGSACGVDFGEVALLGAIRPLSSKWSPGFCDPGTPPIRGDLALKPTLAGVTDSESGTGGYRSLAELVSNSSLGVIGTAL